MTTPIIQVPFQTEFIVRRAERSHDREPDKFHSGQDFAAEAGHAYPRCGVWNGGLFRVQRKAWDVVIVRNSAGGYSLYGHMLTAIRLARERIWPGDTIGLLEDRRTGPGPFICTIR